jgi:hypothetical protein
MDFVIAVRSYDRPDLIMIKTYAFLKECGLLDKTYIFVANQTEYERYKINLQKDGFDLQRLIVGERGGAAINRFISNYFPEGQRLLCLDDDLMSSTLYNKDTKKFCNGSPHFRSVIEECFTVMEANNFGSFTFNYHTSNSPNGLLARASPKISFKNNFLQGSHYGTLNNRELLHTDDIDSQIDDTLRTAKFFNRYGGVMTYHYFSIKNMTVGVEKGGLQSSGCRGTDTTRDSFTLESCNRASKYDYIKDYITGIERKEQHNMYSLKWKNLIGWKKVLQAKNIPLRITKIE